MLPRLSFLNSFLSALGRSLEDTESGNNQALSKGDGMNMNSGVLLVAYDGSPSAQAALKWAARNAPLLDLRIEVINVWARVESVIEMAALGFGSSGFLGEGDPEAWSKLLLEEGVSEVFGPEAENIKLHSIEDRTVKTLVDYSRKVDLLAMGSQEHGKLNDLILGSVSESLKRKSKCPVVIVHAESDD